jgi:hypothetical protein
MTAFLERIHELAKQLERYDRLKEERDTMDALRSRGRQVSDARTQTERALDSFALVERMGAKVTPRPRLSQQLRAKPANLAKNLADNADELVRDLTWVPTLLEPLQTFTTRVNDAAKEAWQGLVDKKVPPLKDEVFKQLDPFQTPAQIQEVQTARERLRQLRANLPASAGALAEVEAAGQRIQDSLQRLQDLPSAVQNFLAKAATYQATADDFTLEVQRHLRDNQLLSLVRIGLEK